MTYVFKIDHAGKSLLLINFALNLEPNKIVSEGEVTALYNGDNLIGYNIFTEATNLKTGLVLKVSADLEKKINKVLTKNNFTPIAAFAENKFVVGEVLECVDHPDSNHLHVCKVNVGSEILQIVCGASNVEAGIKVVVAKVGTMMFDGTLISPSQLRKVDSHGMLCSARELALPSGEALKGILILDDSYEVGESYFK